MNVYNTAISNAYFVFQYGRLSQTQMLSQDYANDDYDFQSQSQNDGFLSQDQQRYNSQPRNDRFNGGGTSGSGSGNFSQGMQFSQVNSFRIKLSLWKVTTFFCF